MHAFCHTPWSREEAWLHSAGGHIGQKVTPGPSSSVTTRIEDTLILHKKGAPVTKARTIVVSIWKIEMKDQSLKALA